MSCRLSITRGNGSLGCGCGCTERKTLSGMRIDHEVNTHLDSTLAFLVDAGEMRRFAMGCTLGIEEPEAEDVLVLESVSSESELESVLSEQEDVLADEVEVADVS